MFDLPKPLVLDCNYMIHHKFKQSIPKLPPLIASAVVVFAIVVAPSVQADQFDEQIKLKERERAGYQSQSNVLGAQANTVEGQVTQLQGQIAAIQVQIDANTKRHTELTAKIKAAEKKLTEQRDLLADNIRSMTIEGDISPLEMLASSKNISDYVDKQEQRNRIKDNITNVVDEIETLKTQLSEQRTEVVSLLEEQKGLRSQVSAKEAQASAKLSKLNMTKAQFDKKVQKAANEISSLRAQQAAANASFWGTAGSGPACGGGYPGQWCNIAMDTAVDSWGMYNRECVSYTAFRVAASGRHMPHWGGRGNANQWPSSAQADGIPVDSNPKAGDVAISYAGPYGHAMYVEAVSGGSILISDYNVRGDGTYTGPRWVSAAGLVFIHF